MNKVRKNQKDECKIRIDCSEGGKEGGKKRSLRWRNKQRARKNRENVEDKEEKRGEEMRNGGNRCMDR